MSSETEITPNRLAGTWSLVGAVSTASSGERNENPYRENPSGLLTYSPDGRVMALISFGGRKPLSMRAGTDEKAEAFETFLAYSGRYTVNGDKVIHRVEISSIQNYVNRDLVRTVIFEGDRMTLVTPPTSLNGKVQTIELTWQRSSKG
ncbi:MAG TPA: lipocalin-like domain-containing protein [Terriglobales bacterium]|nr:lipocalin-like domain-containing protein [Terriglobales bacterium]